MDLKKLLNTFKMKDRILWVLPNYNFYNIQRINLLNSFYEITVIAGKSDSKLGFDNNGIKSLSKVLNAQTTKKNFGFSFNVLNLVHKNLDNKKYVYLACEKKNLLLLLSLLFVRLFLRKKFKLFSYNHLELKSKNSRFKWLDNLMTIFFFKVYDKIVFYTEQSCTKAIEKGYINKSKAFWANNTLDNSEISKRYIFTKPNQDCFTFLFIGRLVPSKNIGVLLDYFLEIKRQLPNHLIKLEIIGDGPQSFLVKEVINKNQNIVWHGTLIDEEKILPIMSRSNIIFVPGLSGLSINHAFFYGRPYMTIKSDNHGPEIDYLKDNINGCILKGEKQSDIEFIKILVNDKLRIMDWSINAFETSKSLSVDLWVKQMVNAIEYD